MLFNPEYGYKFESFFFFLLLQLKVQIPSQLLHTFDFAEAVILSKLTTVLLHLSMFADSLQAVVNVQQ